VAEMTGRQTGDAPMYLTLNTAARQGRAEWPWSPDART